MGTPGTFINIKAHLIDAKGTVTEVKDEISWQSCGGDISKALKVMFFVRIYPYTK